MLVVAVSAALVAQASAQSVFSWEDGTTEDWVDTGWSSPDWTNKAIASRGATDGDLAYTFTGAGAFNWGDQHGYANSQVPWSTPVTAARWNALRDGNMLLMDFSVQGLRSEPIDPNNAAYIAFYPAFNGPSAAGGFVHSYNSPVDFDTGEVAQYQLAFSPEYFTDVRTRTIAWDYVNAGYDFSLLNAVENPPGSGSWTGHFTLMHISQNSNLAGIESAMDNVRAYRARSTDPSWSNASGGGFGNGGNWSNGTPSNLAILPGISGTTDVAITLDAPVSLESLVFNNMQRNGVGRPLNELPTQYSLSGAALTLAKAGGEASLVVLAGANSISSTLNIDSDAVIDLAADTTIGDVNGVPSLTGAALAVGDINLNGRLRTTSVGLLTVNGSIVGGAGSALAVNGAGITLTAGGDDVIRVDDFSIASRARLDLADDALVAGVAASSEAVDPTSIRDAIVAGSITSSLLTSSAGIGYATDAQAAISSVGGVAIPGGSVIARLTLLGDTDLDRTVGFSDLLSLAQSYGSSSGVFWANGDFDHNSSVDFNDLLALAQNYNGALMQASVNGASAQFSADFALVRSVVPEPVLASTLLLAGAAMLRRR
jgi:hypothetical protein